MLSPTAPSRRTATASRWKLAGRGRFARRPSPVCTSACRPLRAAARAFARLVTPSIRCSVARYCARRAMYVGRTPRKARRWTAARESLRREFGLKLIQTWLALAFGSAPHASIAPVRREGSSQNFASSRTRCNGRRCSRCGNAAREHATAASPPPPPPSTHFLPCRAGQKASNHAQFHRHQRRLRAGRRLCVNQHDARQIADTNDGRRPQPAGFADFARELRRAAARAGRNYRCGGALPALLEPAEGCPRRDASAGRRRA